MGAIQVYDYPTRKADIESIKSQDYDYDYPGDLRLNPSSEQHAKLVAEINHRAKIARSVLDSYKTEWQKLDWTLNAYVPLDKKQAEQKAKDWRKPQETVIPMSFAALEIFLTYFTTVFGKDPIHRILGVGGRREQIGGMLMQKVIARQNKWFKELLHLNTMWRDAFTYGFGVVTPEWRKRKARRVVDEEVTDLIYELVKDSDLGVKPGDVVRMVEERTLYEGNRLQNIDPYNFLIDPNVTPNEIQDAEYLGWVERTSAMSLLGRETDPEERLFNSKYVYDLAKEGVATSHFYDQDESGRNTRQGTENIQDSAANLSSAVDVTRFFMELIPRDWELSNKDYPEKWMFSVAGDEVIVQAQPLDLDHGMWPVAVAAPNTDGHSVVPVSHIATTYGLQETINFYFNSDRANQAKAINDMVIADGSKIFMEDLKRPGPGKIIRTRPGANINGADLNSFIRQLDVRDVTARHAQNAMILVQLMKETNGTTDLMMGDMSSMPERPTEQGIQAMHANAASRLQRLARIVGEQSMLDIGFQEVMNTLQFMDESVAVRITEDDANELAQMYGLGSVTISPFDLEPSFDIDLETQDRPNPENVSAWTTIIQAMMGMEGVGQAMLGDLDMRSVFMHWARMTGATDIGHFLREGGAQNTQVVPDEQVAQQVQAGNYAPVEEFNAA